MASQRPKSRTLTATINWALAACVALLMSSAYLLDGPDDIQTAQDVADDLRAAKRQAAIDLVATTARGTSAKAPKGV